MMRPTEGAGRGLPLLAAPRSQLYTVRPAGYTATVQTVAALPSRPSLGAQDGFKFYNPNANREKFLSTPLLSPKDHEAELATPPHSNGHVPGRRDREIAEVRDNLLRTEDFLTKARVQNSALLEEVSLSEAERSRAEAKVAELEGRVKMLEAAKETATHQLVEECQLFLSPVTSMTSKTASGKDELSEIEKFDVTTQTENETSNLARDASARDLTLGTTAPAQHNVMETPIVVFILTCADFVAACLFTYGCVMFIPSNAADPNKMLTGLNLFALGIIFYILLTAAFCRETLKMVGAKSMELAELVCSMLGMVLFLLALVLFYPANMLPSCIEAIRKPFITLCDIMSPEYVTHLPGSNAEDPGPQGFALTAVFLFLLGSLLFCVAPMLHMINMKNENLKHQAKDAINQLVKGVAGVLFTAGVMLFIPGVGCNDAAMALGSYLFIGASLCFVMTAVSDMISAAMTLRRNV